jgi:hypothetical protein
MILNIKIWNNNPPQSPFRSCFYIMYRMYTKFGFHSTWSENNSSCKFVRVDLPNRIPIYILSPYIYWLQGGRSGDRTPVGARFSSPVQTGPGAHPTSCTMNTGSFPWVKSGRGVTLTTHPLLVPASWKSRAIHLLSLLAVRPVQSFSACTRVTFTFLHT